MQLETEPREDGPHAHLGLLGGFAISAASGWSEARDAGCSDAGVCPDPSSRDQAGTAGQRADIATGLVIGGLAVAATGIILYWTAPELGDEAGVSARLAGDRFTIALEGRF